MMISVLKLLICSRLASQQNHLSCDVFEDGGRVNARPDAQCRRVLALLVEAVDFAHGEDQVATT